MTMPFIPCYTCKWYFGNTRGLNTCKAFPQGIPREVLIGKNQHQKKIEGDHGIQYAPKIEEKTS